MLLSALADAWWTDAPWTPDLPGRKSLHVAVFSSPGSTGLRPILAQVQRRGWSASLFIKALQPPPERQSRRLRELFFLSTQPGYSADVPLDRRPSHALVGKREQQVLADALGRDLATYGGQAGGLVKYAAAI